MSTEKKTTQLFKWHEDNGGNMVEFGDYVMPLWYAGTKKEHLAVISNAGAFDTSHMAGVLVNGAGAFDLIQKCFTRDFNSCVGKKNDAISPGRCVYGAFLSEKGEAIDDAIVYKFNDLQWMVVVNAGMGGAIAAHLEANKADLEATCTDLTDKLGKFDIQGPASVPTLAKVLKDPKAVFKKMFYFSFKGHFDADHEMASQVQLLDGTPLMLSRSGYTGEVGFEVFIKPEHTVKAWTQIMEAGAEYGVTPCGLASRDSLRTGAVLPLSHQDIGAWNYSDHPWPFALPFNDDNSAFTKEFIGKNAITNPDTGVNTVAFAGFDVRKVDGHGSVVLDENDKEIGTVLTCATDMAIGRKDGKIYSLASDDKPEGMKIEGLCCGFIKVSTKLNAGDIVFLKDEKRKLKVQIETNIRPARSARKPLKSFLK
jgi:aminomethyltransferase